MKHSKWQLRTSLWNGGSIKLCLETNLSLQIIKFNYENFHQESYKLIKILENDICHLSKALKNKIILVYDTWLHNNSTWFRVWFYLNKLELN